MRVVPAQTIDAWNHLTLAKCYLHVPLPLTLSTTQSACSCLASLPAFPSSHYHSTPSKQLSPLVLASSEGTSLCEYEYVLSPDTPEVNNKIMDLSWFMGD